MTKKIFPNRFLLTDKIALITGGAGLLGSAAVQGLAEAQATVYILDTDKHASTTIVEKATNQGLNVNWMPFDITSTESIKKGFKKMYEKEDSIDILVNTAYPRTKDWGAAFEDIRYDSWRKNVDMHMNGYAFCCLEVAKYMKQQKTGCLINFGSTYGLVGPDFSIYEGTQMTMPAAYAAIKGGIINFTRYLATYLGSDGIRANVICPGGIRDKQPAGFIKKYEAKTPLGRMGSPEDIAAPVVFLASDAASYISGHVLMVDGGWTAW